MGTEELTWGNIYSRKKIRSLTSETGLSVSLGIERQVFWENGSRLELSFAASKIDNLTYTPSSSLEKEFKLFGEIILSNKIYKYLFC